MTVPRVTVKVDDEAGAVALEKELAPFVERLGSPVAGLNFLASDDDAANVLLDISTELAARLGVPGVALTHQCSHAVGEVDPVPCSEAPDLQQQNVVL